MNFCHQNRLYKVLFFCYNGIYLFLASKIVLNYLFWNNKSLFAQIFAKVFIIQVNKYGLLPIWDNCK